MKLFNWRKQNLCLRHCQIYVMAVIAILLFSMTSIYGQTNTPDSLLNLALTEDAVVSGNAPEDGRGIPTDILWDPSAEDWATRSRWHEYGMAFDSTLAATKENPLYWQVIWTEPKNVNHITCSGVYGNQPQPTTGWAVQVLVDSTWQDLAKAHNGWNADTLRGVGYGKLTQTNWLWNGQLVWRGLEPVVTKGIRFTAYANPDSLADGKESFADSLWSFAWTGRDFGTGTPKAVLIQYLDFSNAEADNELDPMINLALLDEAVVSADFQEWDFLYVRGQPADILYDPVKYDYHNKNTYWGEFGYPFQYDAGFPEGPDDGFQYIVEWPAPKKINYLTWGGGFDGWPQSWTPWALQYWDGETWETLIDGIGGSWFDWRTHHFDTLRQYTPGVDAYAQSVWTAPIAEAIETKKIRLAAWSDGIYQLWSFHIRGFGGGCINFDDRENPFKAVLIQYAEIVDPTTAVDTNDGIDPAAFALHQSYPNPFNPKTMITYELPMSKDVKLAIYNLTGQKVATLVSEKQNAGLYQVAWDATGFASGIYTCQLRAGHYHEMKKMLLVK